MTKGKSHLQCNSKPATRMHKVVGVVAHTVGSVCAFVRHWPEPSQSRKPGLQLQRPLVGLYTPLRQGGGVHTPWTHEYFERHV